MVGGGGGRAAAAASCVGCCSVGVGRGWGGWGLGALCESTGSRGAAGAVTHVGGAAEVEGRVLAGHSAL